MEVKHWMDEGPSPDTDFNQTQNAMAQYPGVRRRLIRAVVKRETAQTIGQGPQCVPSGKGSTIAETARRLAQKQPLLQRVRNSSLVE